MKARFCRKSFFLMRRVPVREGNEWTKAMHPLSEVQQLAVDV